MPRAGPRTVNSLDRMQAQTVAHSLGPSRLGPVPTIERILIRVIERGETWSGRIARITAAEAKAQERERGSWPHPDGCMWMTPDSWRSNPLARDLKQGTD